MGDQKKKRWAEDGRLWAMCPSNKKKKMGVPPKKKDGETPIFFLEFLAHIFRVSLTTPYGAVLLSFWFSTRP